MTTKPINPAIYIRNSGIGSPASRVMLVKLCCASLNSGSTYSRMNATDAPAPALIQRLDLLMSVMSIHLQTTKLEAGNSAEPSALRPAWIHSWLALDLR